MSLIALEQPQSIEDAEKQRQKLNDRLVIVHADLLAGMGSNQEKRATAEISQLESEITRLDEYISGTGTQAQELASQQAEKENALRARYARINDYLDQAEQRESELLQTIEGIVADLEKAGGELMALRQEILQQIDNSGVWGTEVLPSEHYQLYHRRETIGMIAWDILRFLKIFRQRISRRTEAT